MAPPSPSPSAVSRLRSFRVDGRRVGVVVMTFGDRIRWSAAEQVQELIYRKSGVRDDMAQGADPELPMVRNHDPCMWYVPPKDHVTSRLAPKNEAGPFQGTSDLSPGQVCRQLRHEIAAPFTRRQPRRILSQPPLELVRRRRRSPQGIV